MSNAPESHSQDTNEGDGQEIKPLLLDIGEGYMIDPNDIIVPSYGPAQFKGQKLIFKPDSDGGMFYFPDGKTFVNGIFGVKIYNREDYASVTITDGKISSTVTPQEVIMTTWIRNEGD